MPKNAINPALYERMETWMREFVDRWKGEDERSVGAAPFKRLQEARAIVAQLSALIDPDIALADEIVRDHEASANAEYAGRLAGITRSLALAAIKRTRQEMEGKA